MGAKWVHFGLGRFFRGFWEEDWMGLGNFGLMAKENI
jgi:mannitol-1-phosphate/altronate dehydrogenase